MKNIRNISILLLLFVLLSGSRALSQIPQKSTDLRVLFIGNSLTYVNDVPEIVKTIAEHNGKKFKFKMLAEPNFALEDHWNNGLAVRAIKEGKWDFVVLQQGSSALPESRTNLIEYTNRFAKEIKQAKAKPALFMVWPFESRKFDFERVHDSYALAAKEVEGLFLPAGDAWRAAWKQDVGLKLYSDGLHATPLGSCLAAAVIYKFLYDEKLVEMPVKIKTSSIEIKLSANEKQLIEKAVINAT